VQKPEVFFMQISGSEHVDAVAALNAPPCTSNPHSPFILKRERDTPRRAVAAKRNLNRGERIGCVFEISLL
jgi:hypothetical protein